ncbi:MAG: lytic transglycosylase domain-containing protein [Alphaproteobacteria bacterium]|nr:lytic transglycosylase domain-containing protein [Alphaproteobacteria bacterium]
MLLWCPAAWAGTPDVLSESDAQVYRKIFTLQEKGDFAGARKLTGVLDDDVLNGYVLYHRFFAKGYPTKAAEITAWLDAYGDFPMAADVYALGKQKKARLPAARPKSIFGGQSGACSYVTRQEPIDLVRGKVYANRKATTLMRQIARALATGQTLRARRHIESDEMRRLIPRADIASARTALAFSYFLDGHDRLAAEQLKQINVKKTPLAAWTAGLVAWRQGRFEESADYFAYVSDHSATYPLLRASASFWTARAHIKTGRFEHVKKYLSRAAENPRVFYGLLAMRLLGQDLNHVWDIPGEANDDVTADFSHPALTRVYALRQIGRDEWAKRELSQLYLEADAEARSILRMISQKAGFEEDLMGLTGQVNGDNGARYPAPNWTPTNGWRVDKALVYAFVRQESCFNDRAQSAAGAVGLMQLMPKTARELARQMAYPWKVQNLKEPEYNLALGQIYLRNLLQNPQIENNLIYTAVAYNAGPGNLAKWKSRKMKYDGDPLLFLESIPSKETRAFAERIMVNYWVYRSLMDQPLTSLDEVAQGRFPAYRALD